MAITFLIFALELLGILFLGLLTAKSFASGAISLSDLPGVFVTLFGLIFTFLQFGNPFSLYKKIIGGFAFYPLFRWQLKSQLNERLILRKSSLVGEGRKFVHALYIERQDAENHFAEFINSQQECFAITGESGIGKTNLLLGLSEKYSQYPQLFFQGKQIGSSIKHLLEEDLPWAFRDGQSLLEAGKLISQTANIKSSSLLIFIDGLDDIASEDRFRLIEEIHLLTQLGIRFVISCKDVIWPAFNRINTSKTALFDIAYPKNHGADIAGYELERCSDAEIDIAWRKYSKYFDLKGEISKEIRQELSLLYMLRLIGETFHGHFVPEDLNSADLFDAYWQGKQEKIGDPLSCLVVVRALASSLLRLRITEVAEIEIWPSGLSDQLKRAFDGLEAENVVMVRTEKHQRVLSLFHEKFQSFAISILLGEWNKRTGNDSKQLAEELISMADNQLVLNAFEFFVLAYDQGVSPLSADILEADLLAATHLFSQVHEPYSISSDKRTITEQDKLRIENKFTQLVRILSLLYAKYFPKISSKQLINQRIGGFISIQGDYLARAFIRSETPLEIIRDDAADLHHERFEGKTYRITSHLTSGNWIGFDEIIPFIEAFKILNEDMRNNFKVEHWREQYLPPRFGELEIPRLAAERAWNLLFRCYVQSYRRGTSGGQWGLFKLLRFESMEDVFSSNLSDLIIRTRYEILWLFVQRNNMVELEKRLNGGTYTTPENALVDELCAQEWELARFLSEVEFRNKYVTHITQHALVGLLDVLLSLETENYDLFGTMRGYQILGESVWPRPNDLALGQFFGNLINEIPEVFRSLVENSFPAIRSLFSQSRLEKCRLLLQINSTFSETYMRTRIALLENTGKEKENSRHLVFINKEVLPGYDFDLSEIQINNNDFVYSGFMSVDSTEIHDLPLEELVFELMKQDINSILRRLPFWRGIWG